MQGCFEAVAAIVAGAAGNPPVLRVRRHRQRKAGRDQACALHEGVIGKAG
jgi:hypothetical protein